MVADMKSTFVGAFTRAGVMIVAGLSAALTGALSAAPVSLPSFDWPKVGYLEADVHIVGTAFFKPGENLVIDIQWRENREGHYYRRLKQQRFGKTEVDIANSYDGSVYGCLVFEPDTPNLKIGHEKPSLIETFLSRGFPLEPFLFLADPKLSPANSYIGLNDLSAYVKNADLMNAMSHMTEATFDGKPARAFLTKSQGRGPKLQNPGTYKVYFSAGIPPELLGWDVSSADRGMVLKITKWDTFTDPKLGQEIRYPSEYTEQCYLIDQPGDKKTNTYGYTVTVRVKSLSEPSSGEDFSLDPSLADHVYDLDNNVQIPVPK
jgi:hypothetical protein